MSDDRTTRTTAAETVERARRAFGDALSTRVNMKTPLGGVPVHVIREAMAEALAAIGVVA